MTYFDPVDLHVSFPDLERKLLEHWYNDGIVDKYLHKNDKSDKYFSFLDGPITANNPMGVHHAWGRSYKDLWQRFKNMQGYRERFQNGFDCQGLWVEVEVEKELGLHNKKDIENLVPGDKSASIAKFIDLCKARVLKYSGIQTEQTKRLGNFMDWEHSYFTMSPENNYMIWHFLKKCFEKDLIYKGHDSVPWCPRCGTAISQHEMLTEDYKDAVHESVFFALPVSGEDYSLLVWTTTPWTIPANVAVAVHPDYYYRIWRNTKTNKKYLILQLDENKKGLGIMERLLSYGGKFKELLLELQHDGGVDDLKGSELLGKKYNGPFDDLEAVRKANKQKPDTFHSVIPAKDLVTPHEGSGLVHIAPGAGTEDFALGKQFDLPVVAPIDEEANYYDGFGDFSGKNAKKHPELIIDALKPTEFFVATHQYKHRYPACWRCKTELVWRVVDEWYIAMDKSFTSTANGKARTLRQDMIEVAKKITWMPEFGLKRELDWLSNMHDWLISKKRYWGLALPIWECPKCHHFEVIDGEEELKEKSIDGWDKFEGHTPHKPFIDEVKIKCSKCGETMSRIPDVGNPWLDAGIVPYSTIAKDNQGQPLYKIDKKQWERWFPANFITESFPGQFKNWFYSMIAMSTVLEDTNPFERVLGFATLLAEDGRAMHKSWGNSIEFSEGADKMGADVMRFMFAATNPADNMLFGYKKADEVRNKIILKIWNSYNFFVLNANLTAWTPEKKIVSTNILDKWIDARLNQSVYLVTKSLDAFDAASSAAEIDLFLDDLSNWYIRRSRDRINEEFLSTLYEVLINFSKLIAPIMPFIADIIYTNLTKDESVHLSSWPKANKFDKALIEKMKTARGIAEVAHSLRKELKIPVRQPLQSFTSSMKIEDPEFLIVLKDEINAKEILFAKDNKWDTKITPHLKAEGDARGLIRDIQGKRKELGTALTDRVDVKAPSWPKEFEEYIKKEALVAHLAKGEFTVSVVSE